MSRRDKERWDKKWADAGEQYSPHPLLVNHADYLAGGSALDLACGRGQNAIWLGQHGYHVLGVDISPVAVEAARAQAALHDLAEQVKFEIVDLDVWSPAKASSDLVIVFRYLNRRLFAPLQDGVRPGGLVYYGTRHLGALVHFPEANKEYLLRPGELKATFSSWRILYYQEGPVNAELIARKPD